MCSPSVRFCGRSEHCERLILGVSCRTPQSPFLGDFKPLSLYCFWGQKRTLGPDFLRYTECLSNYTQAS